MTRLTRWLSGPTSATRPAAPRRTLRLEALEGREVPAVITVTSLADNLDVDGFVTLREAIQAANTNASVDGSSAGDGSDTIVFDSSLANGTVTLSLGELFLSEMFASTTVDGGGVITVDGNNASRVFSVGSYTQATLRGLTITGGNDIGSGGGVFNANNGELNIDRSVLIGNTATFGGGVFNSFGGTMTIDRSTISGNTAASGGGVYNSFGTATLERSTVAGNSASSAGGGVFNNGNLIVGNSLLVGNSAPNNADVFGAITTNNGGNLIGLGGFTLDQILEVDGGGQPLLANNGGPTQTIALVAGSPAIGVSGTATAGQSLDQRGFGFATAQGSTDAGAYQFSAIAPEAGNLVVDITGDITNAFDGQTSLREAVAYANTLTGSRTVTFDASLANSTFVLSNGALVISSRSGTTTVDGGGVITVDGNNSGGVFEVQDWVTAALRGLTLTGGNAGGGGVYNAGILTIDQTTITGNTSINGGGIYNSGHGDLTITNSTISNNTANNGGGIHNNGTLSIADSVIDGNTSDFLGGGGIFSQDATLTLLRTTVSNNTSTYGGGVYVYDGGTASITDSTFTGNTADNASYGGWGGGLWVTDTATVTVTRSNFTGNTGLFGGGVFNEGHLTITDSTASGNTATNSGGAVYNDGVFTLIRSTFVGNSAQYGGAVYTANEADISDSTLVGNTAFTEGGGVRNDDVLHIANSLVVGNTAPSDPDILRVDHDNGGNLIGLPVGVTLGQVVEVDGSGNPVLADNGGPTHTVALAAGSPAIRNGTGSGSVDQRGVTRNAVRDTGAFETQPVTVTAAATGGVANGSPIGVTGATVTGLSGTLATFGDAALVYTYYAGTLDAGQIATATPLAGTPTDAGDYTAVAEFTTAGYRDTRSTPIHFTITPAPVSPPVPPPEMSLPPQTSPVTSEPTPMVPPVSPPMVPPAAPPVSPPIAPPVLVVTAPNGSSTGTSIKVFDPATGENTREVVPFAGFNGAVDVATGDFNGDGVADVVVGAGATGGPRVRVLDGATGAVLADFFAFTEQFTGGVNVAVGDVNGDGTPDLIVAAGPGGGPHVKVFDGDTFTEVRSFFAYASSFNGGVNVAAGDVDGDGLADIVTGAGKGGGSHVKAFRGADLAELYSFFAFAPNFDGGVSVAAGDVNGDGLADIIAGAGAGGPPAVSVFDGRDGTARGSFLAFDAGFAGGVRVGVTDADGLADIVTAAGPGGGPNVRVFSGRSFDLLSSTFAFGNDLLGGVSVS